jgi:hypothetical protein
MAPARAATVCRAPHKRELKGSISITNSRALCWMQVGVARHLGHRTLTATLAAATVTRLVRRVATARIRRATTLHLVARRRCALPGAVVAAL